MSQHIWSVIWLSILFPIYASADHPQLMIERLDDGLAVRVIARMPADGSKGKQSAKRLEFSMVSPTGELGPPIFGKLDQEAHRWVFVNRYRLAHNQLYRAKLILSSGKIISTDYRTPRRQPGTSPRVERVFPSTNRLPANHLKFYIHFSKPMREGREIFDRISLRNQNGETISGVWRRTELWTADARRFTLWIHPGRVKKGVNLREDEGPVLVPGNRYSLVIGPDLLDSTGNRLEQKFVKQFEVVMQDEQRPLPSAWKLTPPTAGTRQTVKLHFGEPLDSALLQKFLDITDASGSAVAGTIELGKAESSWEFLPREPWKKQMYQISVDGMLEDLAGNTPARVFDSDLSQPKARPSEGKLTFHPK